MNSGSGALHPTLKQLINQLISIAFQRYLSQRSINGICCRTSTIFLGESAKTEFTPRHAAMR